MSVFSTAGTNTLMSQETPVNSITLLEASAAGSALAVVRVTSAEPATDLDKYPTKASKTLRLLLVLVPHVLALAPVAMSSSLSLSEYVHAF